MSGYHKRDWETFPMDKIKRVDRPTTMIDAIKVKRVREREGGFMKAASGDFGPILQREFRRFVPKHPLSGSLSWMRDAMKPLLDGMAADRRAPLPTEPGALSRHIKETAYFLEGRCGGHLRASPYARSTATVSISITPTAGEAAIELPHKYAVAVLIDQDYRTSRAYTGSDWISNAMSMLAYTTSGFVAIILADYIRRLGLSGEGALCALLRRRASAHSPHGGPRGDEQDRRFGAPPVPRTPIQRRGGHYRPAASSGQADRLRAPGLLRKM